MQCAAAALLLPALALAAPPGDPLLGREKADTERCLECHGTPTEGQGFSTGTDGKFARLGGQQYEYIVKQVKDFRSGKRKHEFMQMMARGISDADLADIAAYFAAQPAMPVSGISSSPAAQQLYSHGDPARKLPACASCHGEGGKGLAGVAPVIGGQGKAYLEQQLRDWRGGTRRNSAGDVMNQFTKPLSDAEIEALARYVSDM
jgi:cytochrome c553